MSCKVRHSWKRTKVGAQYTYVCRRCSAKNDYRFKNPPKEEPETQVGWFMLLRAFVLCCMAAALAGRIAIYFETNLTPPPSLLNVDTTGDTTGDTP